ncbi:MAG: sulfatase-like hydrolase/transferase [Bradymonadia bacterium]
MTQPATIRLPILLLTMVIVDVLCFQLGYYFFLDVTQNWDLVALLKYCLSISWSVMFWFLWALIGSGLKNPRFYIYGTSILLTLSLAISLYFKAEFFHLPNINTYLFALDEPLNTVILMKDKAMQLSSLLMVPLFLISLKFCTALLSSCIVWRNTRSVALRRYVFGGLLAVFLSVSTLSLGWHRFAYPLTFDANVARILFQHALMLEGNTSNLRHPTRLPIDTANESPVNVLILLNESLRADALIPNLRFTDSLNPSQNAPFFQKLSADSNFVVFPKGYANSNTTNVSIPSLLTGLSPDATSTDFHTLPVAWNYAKAAQSQTFLFTSQDWTWEHFDHFFFSRDIDHIFHRKSAPDSPLVNDLGVNDALTLERFSAHLKTLDHNKPFFGLLQYNNTHAPFYGGEESLKLEAFSKTRYLEAVKMVDELIYSAIEAVKNTASTRPTLVFITSDHGEGLKYRKIGRHDNFFEEMVRVPFAVYVAPGKSVAHAEMLTTQLKRTAQEPVQNTDIVPSLLSLWNLPKDDRLTGLSLLQPLPRERLIKGMGTCEIRKWSPEGFFLRYERYKLVVAQNRTAKVFDLSLDERELEEVRLDSKSKAYIIFTDTIRESQALTNICQRIGLESCIVPTDESQALKNDE